MPMNTFGERLRAARQTMGMTQEDLAKLLNVARNTVSSWERDRTKPDFDTAKRLFEVLHCDLFAQTESDKSGESSAVQPPEPAAAPEGIASEHAADGAAPGANARLGRWFLILAAVVCAALLAFFAFLRPGAQTGKSNAFDAEFYLQEAPNESGKAYFTFNNVLWEENGENRDYDRFAFSMYEKNGVGFDIAFLEIGAEGVSGSVFDATYTAVDLAAAEVETSIPPYGEFTFDGGWPRGQFLQVGIAVHGTDAAQNALTFYSLIKF